MSGSSERTEWDHYGEHMNAHEAVIEDLFSRFSNFAMDRARVGAGERVVDLGCGSGETTLELAGRVGEQGQVLGLDLSAVMLARAEERARAADCHNASFAKVDVEHDELPAGPFDRAFSRFGVMFFGEPVAAFTRLRQCLTPSGRLTFVCWQPLASNTWIDLYLATVAQNGGRDIRPPIDEESGVFAFGERDRPRRILEGAGFGEIRFTPHTPAVPIFGIEGLDEFIEFSFVQLHEWLVRDERKETLTPELRDALRDAFAPYHTDRGVVMQSATWVIEAEVAR